jgi:hypothetical protein
MASPADTTIAGVRRARCQANPLGDDVTQKPDIHGQMGDDTLESQDEELTYFSDSVSLDQKRHMNRLIHTVVTIGGRSGWRTTTSYLRCRPRVLAVLAHPRVVRSPRRFRPCARARSHTAARSPASRSSSGTASGDSAGSGGDGSGSGPAFPRVSRQPSFSAPLARQTRGGRLALLTRAAAPRSSPLAEREGRR